MNLKKTLTLPEKIVGLLTLAMLNGAVVWVGWVFVAVPKFGAPVLSFWDCVLLSFCIRLTIVPVMR